MRVAEINLLIQLKWIVLHMRCVSPLSFLREPLLKTSAFNKHLIHLLFHSF